MSAQEQFDFVVIGGGSAGYAAAGTAAKLGLRVALIEGGQDVGGLCILRGCMPSKTLIESANRFETLRRAREFGLRAECIGVDGGEIMARKERLVEEFASYRKQQIETGAFEFIRGWARFADAHVLEVRGIEGDGETRRIFAKTILIATGSVLKRVELPGLAETGFLDSDAVLASARIPKSVIVLGAGAIGLELAHYYLALGVEVTILQRSQQVLKEMDGDVAASLARAFTRRGARMFFCTTLVRFEKTAAGEKRVIFQQEGVEKSVKAEEIIYALGRAPALDGLGLDRAGLAAMNGRLSVNLCQQTSVPHIFAAGDAAGPHEIVHIAIQQGELAARNAARLLQAPAKGGGEPLEQIDYRLKLFVVFSEPQAAAVGFTERELLAARADYRVARYSFADHGKAMVRGETDGFVKLIAAAGSCELLGAAAVGPLAGELIHEIAVALYFHATAHDLMQVPHYHPTLSEIWTYPAEELALG